MILRASLVLNTEVSLVHHKAFDLTVIMAAEPHVYIVTCVRRCDDRTILCETCALVPPRVVFQERSEREQRGRRCLQREGMRHWISAWESVPASSSWAAETPPEGHDTRCSLSLHQAFHMSQPSLTSPPGWRKKRKRTLCSSSSCFTSPQVRTAFLFLVFFLLFFVCG